LSPLFWKITGSDLFHFISKRFSYFRFVCVCVCVCMWCVGKCSTTELLPQPLLKVFKSTSTKKGQGIEINGKEK
jgi:hypothetical protein